MWKHLVAGLVLIAAPSPGSTQSLEVRLETISSDLGERRGMSNLNFARDGSLAVPVSWDSTEVALLTNVNGRNVQIARGWTAGGWEYRVDHDDDGTVENEAPLIFARVGELHGAKVDVDVQTGISPVRFHVLTADGYAYARLAQEWRGELTLDGNELAVALRAGSRHSPLPALDAPFEMLVDFDGDGLFRDRTEVSSEKVALSEVVRTDQPFRIRGQAFRVEFVDVASSILRLRSVMDSIGVAPGFFAPDIRTVSLDGRPATLADLRGDIVVLEFWSVHCPFSEQIRPAIADLAARHERVRFISIARELESDTIRAHIQSHPRTGELWINQAETWEEWNPRTVTPLFYVIDREGRIAAAEHGAGAAALLSSILAELKSAESARGPGAGTDDPRWRE